MPLRGGMEIFMDGDLMLIGEIAEFFGVSRKAIRLYEKKGILKPVKVDPQNGYRYYSADQVRQLSALLELKVLGFSLDEIKTVLEGGMPPEELLRAMERKRRAWQEAMDAAGYKMECLENIMRNMESSRAAGGYEEMSEQERAWLLVKMVCVEEVRTQKALSEALWL